MTRAEQIVAEAKTWLRTPFCNCDDRKGIGVDCAMLIVRVHVDTKILPPFDPRPYRPQWFQHQEEPKFINWLEKYSVRTESPQPGDVVLMNFGKHGAHGGFVIDEHSMLHSYGPVGYVTYSDRKMLLHRVDSYWTLK